MQLSLVRVLPLVSYGTKLKNGSENNFMFVYFVKIKFELNIKPFCSEDWCVHVKKRSKHCTHIIILKNF